MYFIGNFITGTPSKGSCKSQAGGGGLTLFTQRSALSWGLLSRSMQLYVFRLKKSQKMAPFGQGTVWQPPGGWVGGFQCLKISELYLKQSGFLVFVKKGEQHWVLLEWGLLAGAWARTCHSTLGCTLVWASVPAGTGITLALEKEKIGIQD